MLLLLCAVFLAVAVGPGQCLTADEIAQFRTGGITEMNTQAVGTVSITINTDTLRLESNGIPDHETGIFPQRYNPNYISMRRYSFPIPRYPAIAAAPSCLPMGPIAFSTNGIPIFNLLTNEGTDATIVEVFDSCNGHPDPKGGYHYHQKSPCLASIANNPAGLVGVALDGFAIYGNVDENGVELTTADLDDCHGHAVDGGEYHYHLTLDYPFTLGCYKGTRIARNRGDCSFFTPDAPRPGGSPRTGPGRQG